MSYAVIQLQGKQFIVEPGTILEIDRLESDDKKSVDINDVLLLVTDKTTMIGTPTVAQAKIKAEFVKDLRGEKIRVAKYKAKSRYRKVRGHRQDLTQIKIVSIEAK